MLGNRCWIVVAARLSKMWLKKLEISGGGENGSGSLVCSRLMSECES
jgi:hypothetical protein